MAIGIIYGSNGGVTEEIAEAIQEKLDIESDLLDISDIEMDKFNEYSHLIIGTSTWGEGELQDDWDDVFGEFKNVDFSGKTVAFFGTGDQEGYADNFVDGMGILHDVAVANGATVVGDGWPTDGYDFDDSVAVQNGAFIGLAIDEDNQSDMTKQRIDEWVEIIRPHFS